MGRLTGAAFNAAIHRDDHGRFSGGSTVVRRLLGADAPNAPKTREVHTPGGSTVSIASRATGRSLSGMAARASTPKPKANAADFAAGGAKHIDIARVARGLGDRSDFDHAAGNHLDDAQQQLNGGMTPGQVAKGLDEEARRLSTSNSIRFGVGGSGFRPEHPDDRAARLRQRDEGAAQVDRLRQLASRLRETRRPTVRRTTTSGSAKSDPLLPNASGVTNVGTGRRISREEAGRLMFGDAGFERRAARSGGLKRTAKKAAASAGSFDASGVAAQVGQARSRDQAHEMLGRHTVAQLRQIAKAANVPLIGGNRKADMVHSLTEVLVGGRLDMSALMKVHGDRRLAPRER